MHVGEHRHSGALPDLGEDWQRLGKTDTASASCARAVRLVEGALINEADACRPPISFSASAVSSACARLSSAQGPAISASGKSLPKRAAPTATTGLGVGFMAAVMGGPYNLL